MCFIRWIIEYRDPQIFCVILCEFDYRSNLWLKFFVLRISQIPKRKKVSWNAGENLSRLQSRTWSSSVKFASLDVDAVFSNSHAEVFHSEDSTVLAAALATTAVARSLDTQRSTTTLILSASLCLSGNLKTTCGTEIAHQVVCAGV